MVCLILLCISGMRLIIKGGDYFRNVPAYSIFYEEPEQNKQEEQEKEVLIRGQIYKKSNTSEYQVLYLKNNSITYQEQTYFESNIIIYDKSFINIPIGKIVQSCATIQRFEQSRNPGNFDQREYYAKQGIYGYGHIKKIECISGKENVCMEKLHWFRQRWKNLLHHQLGEKNGAILSAMLLAEKKELDSNIKELYQKNGISHILAISGLHISFIGMGIYEVFRKRLGLSYKLSGMTAVLVLGIYVLMIGLSVSVFRAFIMLLLRMGADVTGKVYDVLTSLLLSAAILAVYQPLYLMDAAFLMSHGAILGIEIVLPRVEKATGSLRKGIKIWEGFLSSVAINIALLPVLLYFYYEFPTYSVFLNVMVIPLMSVVLTYGMFGSLLIMKIPFLGQALLGICGYILTLYERVCDFCNGLPFHSVVLGKPEWWQLIIYYSVLAWWLCQRKTKKEQKKVSRKKLMYALRNRRIRCMVMMILVSIVFVKFPDGKLHITMLDVGQGDCIYIEGPRGTNYLVDGGSSDVKEVGKYRIEPYLKSQGVGQLDYVFVSHGDLDHGNGILEMLERQDVGVKIRNLVLPANYKKDTVLIELAKKALEQNVKVFCIEAGQEMVEGKLRIQCLQPPYFTTVTRGDVQKEEMLTGNEGSMVLQLEFDTFHMLFTGDVEGKGETRLVQNLERFEKNVYESYDVLKVAHHGSKNSSTESFLSRVKPKLALISAGTENRYGHPHRETLERLNAMQCSVLMTAKCGAIMLEVDEEIKVNPWIN